MSNSNRPYEQDSGLLPLLIGSSALVGGGYLSYRAMTAPEETTEMLSRVMNRVFPVTSGTPNPFQERTLADKNAIGAGSKIAKTIRGATFDRRREEEKLVAKSLEFGTAPVNPAATFTGASKYYHELNYGSLEELDKVAGNDAGSRIVNAINKIYSVKKTGDKFDVAFDGTTMKLQVQGSGGYKPLEIHLPQLDSRTGGWISRENSQTTRVYKRGYINYYREGDTFSKVKAVNPIEHVANILEDPMQLLAMLNKDEVGAQRVILKDIKGKLPSNYQRLTQSQLSEHINDAIKDLKLNKTINSDMGITSSVESVNSIQNMLNVITRDSAVYSPANNLAGIEHLSHQYEINPLTRIELEDDFFMFNIRKMANIDKKGSATTHNDVVRFYDSFVSAINKETGLDLRWGGNQEQIAKGVLIGNKRVTAISQAEEFKGISKATPFYDNGIFGKGMISRTKPLLANTSENLRVLNTLLYLDEGTDEVTLLNKEITENMFGAPSKEFHFKSLVKNGGSDIFYKEFGDKGAVGEWKPYASLDQLLNDRYFKGGSINVARESGQIAEIMLPKGTAVLQQEYSDQLHNFEDLVSARELKKYGSLMRAEEDIVMNFDDIANTVKSMSVQAEQITNGITKPATLFGSYVAPVIKASSPYGTNRWNVETIRNKERRLSRVDGTEAKNFYKSVFPKNGKIGKSAAEYLTFLQESIAGHAIKMGRVAISGNALSELRRYTNVGEVLNQGTGLNGDILLNRLFRNGELQFNQQAGNVKDQVSFAQRFLGTLMGGNRKIDTLMGLTPASDLISQNFNDAGLGAGAYRWSIMKGIVPNEIEAQSLGSGHNIRRIGLKELHYYKGQPGVLKEIFAYNLVDSEQVWEQGDKMLASLGEEGRKLNTGARLLKNAEEIKGLGDTMSFLLSSSGQAEFSNPEVLLKSPFADKAINPNGLGIKYLTGNKDETAIFHMPSAGFFGATQYLSEEDRGVVTKTQREMLRFIQNAHENDGTASNDAYQRLAKSVLKEHGGASKKGLYKIGAAHIELASYSKNVSSSEFLNNESLRKNVSKELLSVMDNTALISADSYKTTISRQLEGHLAYANKEGITFIDHVRDFFGEDSRVFKFASERKTHKQIADEMMEESLKLSRMLEEAVTKGTNTKETIDKIRKHASFLDSTRYPTVYEGSTSKAFALAADERLIGKGKKIALGNTLRMLLNADHDGDAIMSILLHSSAARRESLARIDGAQKLSYNMLETLKESKAAKGILSSWEDTKDIYKSPRTIEEIGKFTSSAEYLGRVDTAIGAFMTKAIAGSADIETVGIRNYLLKSERIKGATAEELAELDTFVSNFFPLNIIQKALSGKHIEREIGSTPLGSKLHTIMGNIGEVTKEDFTRHIKDMEGTLDPLSMFTLFKARAQNASWYNEELFNNVSTIFDVQHNLRSVSDDAYIKAHTSLMGDEEEAARSLAKRRAYLKQLMGSEDIRPIMQRDSEILKRANIGLEETYQAIKSNSRDMPNVFSLISSITAKIGKKGKDNEVLAKVFDTLRGFGELAETSKEMMTGEVGLNVGRSVVGLKQLREFTRGITATQWAGAAGLGVIGITALNVIFGDGTPTNPNDLPSVNNPSFRDNRYNHMLENRTLNNTPNNNVSTGLLTDSYSSFDSIMDHLQGNFGSHYSNISVRHDGQDPYKEHMLRYN